MTVSDLCLSNPLWLPQGENGLEWQGKEGAWWEGGCRRAVGSRLQGPRMVRNGWMGDVLEIGHGVGRLRVKVRGTSLLPE